jgi:hypothetical protein
LEASSWLEFGEDARSLLDEKTRLITEHRDDVLAIRPGSELACAELLEEVTDNLRIYHPNENVDVGAVTDPLIAASLIVTEDLCIMASSLGQWRLEAACVCFPSRWQLSDKIGTTLDEIHGPVAGYDQRLAGPTRKYFDRISTAGNWRLNWTLLDDSSLYQPRTSREATSLDPDQWWFRVERQTLRRLARSGAVVFTIRTYQALARDLVANVDGFAANVQEVLVSAPAATIDYKGWRTLAERWAEWFLA